MAYAHTHIPEMIVNKKMPPNMPLLTFSGLHQRNIVLSHGYSTHELESCDSPTEKSVFVSEHKKRLTLNKNAKGKNVFFGTNLEVRSTGAHWVCECEHTRT